MTAARKRGVTWSQITELLTAEGIKATDGEPLTVNEVRALYHAEHKFRLSKRKGGVGEPKVATSAPTSPTRPEALDPPPVTPTRPEVRPMATPAPQVLAPPPASPPSPGGTPANPWAEVDRQTAEAKRRRDERAAGSEWNPYATKEKPE